MNQTNQKDVKPSFGSKGPIQNPSAQRPPEKQSNKYDELGDLSKVPASRLVEIAEEVGRSLSPRGVDLKINQIRPFLDEVRQIEVEVKNNKFPEDRIILLRPKLAYAAGRQPKVKNLMEVLDPAIKSASRSKENFMKLLRLIEGIVAYHRYYGGTN